MSEKISRESGRKMQTVPGISLSLLLVLLYNTAATNGLCTIQEGTVAQCNKLDDVKYIESHDLKSLKTVVQDEELNVGLLNDLGGLRHLDLSGGDLKTVHPGSLRKLSNLMSLDLADNRISYLELGSLDGLNQLRSLNLRRNDIRQLPPALVRLKNLRHLDIQGNPFECNCATLRVRDLLTKRGVKFSRKITCAGPRNMKGASLLKPEAQTICPMEEQDREMQADQPETKSDDVASNAADEDEDKDDNSYEDMDFFEEKEEEEEKEESPVEVETPFPTSVEVSTAKPPVKESTVATELTLEKSSEDELFFDSDEKEDRHRGIATTLPTPKKPIKDGLFYPSEAGSGDEEDGSGSEGSGTLEEDEEKKEELEKEKEEHDGSSATSTTSNDSFLDMLFGVFWSTTAPPDSKRDPDLEEEQFIDASSTRTVDRQPERTTQSTTSTTTSSPVPESSTSAVEETLLIADQFDKGEAKDLSMSGKVQADLGEDSNEMAEVSPARQSKKGMGSYVVLAALLAILAALIGFAAYKGDFCRKRRKRADVETGTELKDMQKSLLDGTSQPKIASNGNTESVPLVDGTMIDDAKEHRQKESTLAECATIEPRNGSADHGEPVKPPRKSYGSSDEGKVERILDSKEDETTAARTASPRLATESNGPQPPLSPAAQRVKITLQENPDSVPKTPLLITRTTPGDDLVKTP